MDANLNDRKAEVFKTLCEGIEPITRDDYLAVMLTPEAQMIVRATTGVELDAIEVAIRLHDSALGEQIGDTLRAYYGLP